MIQSVVTVFSVVWDGSQTLTVPPVRLEKIMKWAVLCLGEHVYFLSEMMDCAFAYDNQVFGSDYFRSKIS